MEIEKLIEGMIIGILEEDTILWYLTEYPQLRKHEEEILKATNKVISEFIRELDEEDE